MRISGSHDVYHAAMLLWIDKGHPKFCGGLPSAVFSYMGLYERQNSSLRKPRETPLSLCVPFSLGQVLHGAQSVAHCLRLCQHRNDVSVFLTDATHAGCKTPRGRRPGERSRASCTWKGSAAGGKSRAKTQK